MRLGCCCSCHQSLTEPYPVIGFDANEPVDVIAAATACSLCRGLHARIFEKPPRPYRPSSSTYSTDASEEKGEGAE